MTLTPSHSSTLARADWWRIGRVPRQDRPVRWIGFHPDGRSIAVAAHGSGDALGPNSQKVRRIWSSVVVYDVATGEERSWFGGHDGPVSSGAWLADGTSLVAACEREGTLWVWNVGQPFGLPIRVLPKGTQVLHGVALTPEGRYAAVAVSDGSIPVFRIPEPPTPYDPGPARPTPDLKRLASRPAAADALKRETVPPALLRVKTYEEVQTKVVGCSSYS